MMDAKSRRGYLSRMRKDQTACLCPECKRKTRHYTVPNKNGDGLCDILCEYCGKTVKEGVNGYIPFMAIRINSNERGAAK